MKKKDNAETHSSLRYVGRPKRFVRAVRNLALTTPDLVLLSLLAERPMHGYQANLELERRENRDWGNLLRPPVDYLLEKMARAGRGPAAEKEEPAGGSARATF